MIYRALKKALRLWRLKRDPVAFARSIGVQIGNECALLGLELDTFGSEPYLVKLGDHVEITSGVRFVTHDGGVWVFWKNHPDVDVLAPIVVGNNVFIGMNSIILPGVHIGDNCVVGAGSVVTHDIPSNSVVAGVPAKRIGTLDEYWEHAQKKALFVHTLPAHEKRRQVENRFRELLRAENEYRGT